MSKEIYVSWVKGLPQSPEALAILKANNLGIEMSNIDEQVEMVRDAGVKFSSHTPGMALTINLADPHYMEVFEGEQGPRLLEVIRESDAPVIGLHLGYSAEQVYKMKAFPNVPIGETLIDSGDRLADRIISNVVALENRVNSMLPDDKLKHIVLETLDFSREVPIPWDTQSEEVQAKREEIKGTVAKYGINAGILFVTDPAFVRAVLDDANLRMVLNITNYRRIKPVNFLFDVGHNFISADAKRHNREFIGTTEDYFTEMLKASSGRTFQLHLTVPEGNDERGYADHHHVLTPGEPLSDRIIELSQEVVRRSPELRVVTLEMRTDLEPVEHARAMVEQVKYTAKQLNL